MALEDQIVHTMQQNEDLRVRIDNCQTLIQYVPEYLIERRKQSRGMSVLPPAGQNIFLQERFSQNGLVLEQFNIRRCMFEAKGATHFDLVIVTDLTSDSTLRKTSLRL